MGLIHFFRRYKWEISGLLLLFFCIIINLFPKDHIILGGDILQPIRMVENFATIHYDAFGRVSLFYGIFYVLDALHVSETLQISWYLGIFLLGSYVSFLSFCSLLFSGTSRLVRSLAALFYATNIYTLYVFTATWGYGAYQIMYIFIPVLTGLYIQSLVTRRILLLFLFLFIVFLTSTSFGNPAFALSLGIYFFLLTAFLFLFRFVPFDKETWKRIAWIAAGSFFLNAYWMLPLFPQMRSGIQEVFSSEVVNLTERLEKTSNAIFDTIRLMSTSEQKRYFPVNFPYHSLLWMKKYIILLAFVPFLIVLIGCVQKRARREGQLYGIFFALFLVFIALVARVRFPFDTVNSLLFHLPGLNTLRGYDKLATFTPFLLSVLLFLSLLWVHGKKYSRVILLVFFLLTITLSLPFYAGGLQTKMSYILSTQKRKNFQEAKWSAIVKIPDPYYTVASVFEADRSDFKISMLPYSPGSSIGRVNLPVWKVNGPHIARFLYSKPYVELTEPYISGWKFAEDFENSQYDDPQWIIDLYGLLGIKYVFYHKDAKSSSVKKMETLRNYLEEVGVLHPLYDNDFFMLYRIDASRVFPYVYMTEKVDVFVQSRPEGFSDRVQALHASFSPLDYISENPKKLSVAVEKIANQSHIFLNEKYDPLWRARYISPEGKKVFLRRDENVTYANAWMVNSNLSGGKVEMYYSPIVFFHLGQVLSGTTLLFVVLGTIYMLRRNKYHHGI